MITTIFLWIPLILITFFPIVIWAYVFSYIDNSHINRYRFFMGIFWWALSVIPILYLPEITKNISFEFLNVFAFVSQISNFFSSVSFGISLALLLLFVVIFSFIFGSLFHKMRYILSIYGKNIWVFLGFILILVWIVYLIELLAPSTGLNSRVENPVIFWDIIFSSLKLVIFYYVVVAFIEEASKHFNFLQSSVLQITTIKEGVLFAIFVALWFSFIENILYFYPLYLEGGISSDLLKIYFLRSVFSVIVHVVCSSVVAYYFSKAYITYTGKDVSLAYLKMFWFWIAMSVLLHLIYDVALTVGFSFVMFLYFIFGYLYVSSIFYRDSKKGPIIKGENY